MSRERRTPIARPVAMACLAAALLWTAAAAAAPKWVTARYLVVRAGTASTTATVATLRYGDKVEALTSDGNFTRVRCAAGEGYVATRWLGDGAKPASGGLLARFGASARGSAGDVGTTAGARGLSPEAASYADAHADLAQAKAQLLALEARSFGPEELDAFLRGGALGDHRGAAAAGAPVTAP